MKNTIGLKTGILMFLGACLLLPAAQPPAPTAQPPAPKKAPPKAAPAVPRPAKPAPPPAAAAAPVAPVNKEPEVLTNDSVIKMVAAGLDPEIVIAKINSSPAAFTLNTDGLVSLKGGNVPQPVVRAMLNWKAPGSAAAGVNPGAAPGAAPPPAAAEALVGNLVKDPGPSIHMAAVPVAPPDSVIARQGMNTFPLSDKPQSVMFVKSEASSAKEAVVNIVLGDVGIQLITMGLQPMMGFNPYLGDVVSKAAKVGKGLLLKSDGDTKGFEIETLTGATADVTLKEGKVEFLIPMNRYIPSADMDPSTIEPVVLRMQPRDNEQRRVLSGRKVVIKTTKKNRFDLKPTTDRTESDVEQSTVPITVERMPENIIRITTNEELKRGEYALVFRKKDAANQLTANVPLKATVQKAEASPEAPAMMPGMTPEMMSQMTPEQIQMMQQSQQGQKQPPRGGMGMGGMFGMGKKPAAPPNTPAPAAGTSLAGFIAWDFRVLP